MSTWQHWDLWVTTPHVLTPANGTAVDVEGLAAGEGDDDDGVQIQALAEHPEEVARYEVLSDDVDRLTPDL